MHPDKQKGKKRRIISTIKTIEIKVQQVQHMSQLVALSKPSYGCDKTQSGAAAVAMVTFPLG